jgi:RNA polymerase sigma-70 factor (ECF subfamily)
VTNEPEEKLEAKFPYAPPIPDGLTDEEVVAAVQELPDNYREVVLLADVEEFSYKEIAEVLSLPMGTVMSRLSRARKALRMSLAGVAETYGIGRATAGGAAKCE